ncbi:hypothetical protein P153DRAFT_362299 [Dothidotthia symphoricarpi CBS 119687]|uniref:Uncharacterized protein n=1 Tax=Dothidotthia symphoricarpi CBS 119687 TaxID=1392245 RepID=A0A6A6ATM1_9PLEO|nr:uncharacterized protein P153DRAFT_362299 [Dothidotthia symphoricarpi CBS 119687]KAF2134538.1 hypothetical protein P153DRAFT_362299 [Dothidotthia symphoricarpi CBS 119687]
MGEAVVIRWLFNACRGEDFTDEEIKLGNTERRDLVPLIGEEAWKPGPELENQILPLQPPPDQASTLPTPHKCSWSYFALSAASMELLKRLTITSLTQDFIGYISTDDALSAFIFQCILRARQQRLPQDRIVSFARAVDARRYLDIHSEYHVILQNMTYISYPLSALLATPLGHIAAAMRYDVDPKTSDIAFRTRSLLTFMSRSPDNTSKISFTAIMRTDADIMLSSWAKVPAYEWDFGLGLGMPEAVRRPGFAPVESLMYVMPKGNDGVVAVAMCLREEDLQELRGDVEWNKHTICVG